MQVKCNICRIKLEKNEAVKFKGKYFHKECRRLRRIKKHIDYVLTVKKNIKGSFAQVKGKINEHLEKYDYKYILFVLRKNINLNHIHGLVYFLDNENFKKEYNIYKSKKIKVKKEDMKIIESYMPQIKIKDNQKWGEIICYRSTQIQKQE